MQSVRKVDVQEIFTLIVAFGEAMRVVRAKFSVTTHNFVPLHFFAIRTYTEETYKFRKHKIFPTHVCTAYSQDFSHTEGVDSTVGKSPEPQNRPSLLISSKKTGH